MQRIGLDYSRPIETNEDRIYRALIGHSGSRGIEARARERQPALGQRSAPATVGTPARKTWMRPARTIPAIRETAAG